ncbi:MAG TPA: T9SS type A sorting domain-containing protein, partial [Aequorivita sp.]|nr:T9SS type A sorting domain-containing protein [Aequorivita sp.]
HRIFPDDQAGQVNVYEFLNNAWSQKGETIEGTYENHYFGGSVSINNTGDIIVAGDFSAFGFGEVKVFKYEFDSWEQYGNTLSGEENGLESFFGFSVGINNEGNVIGIGSPHDSGWEPSQVRVFEYNGVLDAQELMRENVPKLYPNPNFGRFFISIPDVMKAPLIRIADSMGKIIYSKSHSVSKLIEIDQNLSSGIYFVNILTLNSSSILRLIVE